MSSIKESFEDSCLFVNGDQDFQDIYGHTNVIFENSQLKNNFFEQLILNNINHTIINCLSSIEIFEKALYESNGIVIFDNVCCCRNNEILEKVIDYKKKKMLVC